MGIARIFIMLFKLVFMLIRFVFWILSLIFKPVSPLFALLEGLLPQGRKGFDRQRAQYLADTMLDELTRLGFTSRSKKGHKQKVQWSYPLLCTPDEIWCPLNLKNLPTGVTTNDLRGDDVMRSLEDRCHTSIRFDTLANSKLCLVARLAGSAYPDVISINAFKWEPDAPALAFPLGVSGQGEHAICDLADIKHLLIVGATGGGKTTFVHCLINSLISRNSVHDVQLWLIDLKGSEFPRYNALTPSKHRPDGIVKHIATEPEKAVEVLNMAYKEIRRRNDMMGKSSASDLNDYAQLTGQRLPRIVVVIDEIAILTLDTTRIGKQSIGQWGSFLMTKIAALGRSSGVHIVIATQSINTKVLNGMIRANFENRIAFSCADWRQSQLAIETSEADGLPIGRMLFRAEGKTGMYQSCLITPKQTRLEVSRIAEYGPDGGLGDKDELSRFVKDAKLLLTVACDMFEGEFSIRKLYQAEGVRGVIAKNEVEEIAQRLERDGILEPGRSNIPRRVARGFFKHPELLDMRYGCVPRRTSAEPGHIQDTDLTDSLCPDGGDVHPGLQDGTNPVSHNEGSASCVLEDSADTAPDDTIIELPDSIDTFLQNLSDEKPKKKHKKPKDDQGRQAA